MSMPYKIAEFLEGETRDGNTPPSAMAYALANDQLTTAVSLLNALCSVADDTAVRHLQCSCMLATSHMNWYGGDAD